VKKAVAAGLAIALAACASPKGGTTARFPPATSDAVEGLLASLTLEEKVGQLFVVGGNASFMNEASSTFRTLAHHVTDNRVGGVIWFRSQVYETAILTARLQGLSRLPLLVSADLEAGMGMRFDDVTYGPWAMAVAATGDPSLAERRGKATAEESRALGVNQVFAPVADVNINPDNPVINVRSFGEDPQDVARYVAATVKGLEAGGVLATVKHFPGHGDTAADSHCVLPVMKVDRSRLESVELVPFRAGIAAGAGSVMVAHLGVPALDPEVAPVLAAAGRSGDCTNELLVNQSSIVPATLSARITTELLRKELGFDGLIVTDAMRMGGITAHYEAGEAAIRALLAGQDQVLLSSEPDKAIAAVIAAARAGRIPERRLDESVRRVLAAKRRLGLFEQRTPPLDAVARVVDSPEHQAVEAEIARRSLTLVREQAGVLPLDPGKRLALVVIADEATLNGPAGSLVTALRRKLGDAAPRPPSAGRAPMFMVGQIPRPKGEAVILDPRSTPEEVTAAVETVRDADAILVALYVRARSGQGVIAIPASGMAAVPELVATGKPVIAVSFGSPYLLRELPQLQTYICAYGIQELTQSAVVQALYGDIGFGGRLPVTIPGVAPRGTGIQKPPRS